MRLSRTTGPVLDPVFSLRRRVRLEPGAPARVAFVTGAADTREAALALAEQFRDLEAVDRAFAAATSPLSKTSCGSWPDAGRRRPVQPPGGGRRLHRPGAAAAGRRRRQPPGSAGPVAARHLRRPPDRAGPGRGGRRRVRSSASSCSGMPMPAAGAWTWTWSILDERAGEAAERLRGRAPGRAPPASCSASRVGCSSWPRARLSADDAVLLAAAARAVLGGGRGSLADQLDRRPAASPSRRRWPRPSRPIATEPAAGLPTPPEGLLFWNGLGGFTPDGREYVIVIDGTAPVDRPCRRPPGPTCSPTPASAAW